MRADRLTSILVADDDRLVRITLRKILESAGYTVFEAKDGAEAIEVFRKRRPDLVILDIVMPIKDGVRTFLELRGLDSKARIIAMSAGARSGTTPARRIMALTSRDWAGVWTVTTIPLAPARAVRPERCT